MFKHILVPTDGSELSQKAVQKAISFAKEIDAKITFFCAVPQFPVMYYGLGVIFDSHSILDFEEESKSICNEILNKAKEIANNEGVNSETYYLISDYPFEAILEATKQKECDLIFMASHGKKGVNEFFLGSETNKVLSHSNIPVLVYR